MSQARLTDEEIDRIANAVIEKCWSELGKVLAFVIVAALGILAIVLLAASP